MNKKTLIIVVLVLVLTVALTACNHEHVFDDNWTYDADYHWHKATCNDTDEIDGKAAHNMVAVSGDTRLECDVCGYSKQTGNPKPDPTPDPEPPHKHTYAKEYSADEHCHWLPTTCGHLIANTAPHGFVDGVCVTCGWWSSATEVLFAELSKLDVWNFTVTLNDVQLDGLEMFGSSSVTAIDYAELKLAMSKSGQIDGTGCLVVSTSAEYVVNGQIEEYIEAVEMKVVIDNSVLYAYGENVANANAYYIRCGFRDLLRQANFDVEQLETYLQQLNDNTQQIRKYIEQVKLYLDYLPVGNDELQKLFDAVLEVDEQKSTEQLTAYIVKYDALLKLNSVLAAKTVSEYANSALAALSNTPLGALLGDDFYVLPSRVEKLLKQPIGQTLAELRLDNYSIDELIAQLDKLVADYYPDDNVNTVGELLESLGVDLNGVSVKNAILQLVIFSPEDLWNSMQQDAGSKISAAEIADNLDALCKTYGDVTVYQLILADNEQISADLLKQLVDGAAALLEDCVNIEFYVDRDGLLQQSTLIFKCPEVNFDDNNNDDNSEAAAIIAQIKEILSGFNGTIALKRGYKSSIDYSTVIDTVNQYVDRIMLPTKHTELDNLAKFVVGSNVDENVEFDSVSVDGNALIMDYVLTRRMYLADSFIVNDIIIDNYIVYKINYSLTIDFNSTLMSVSRICNDYLSLSFNYFIASDSFVRTVYVKQGDADWQTVTLEEFNVLYRQSEGLDNFDLDSRIAELDLYVNSQRFATLYFDLTADKFVSGDSVDHDYRLLSTESVETAVCGEYCKYVYKCETCGKKIAEYVLAEHDYDNENIRYELISDNCEGGVRGYIRCNVCHEETLYCIIDSFAHEYDYDNGKYRFLGEHTCLEGVERYVSCSLCGQDEVVETIDTHSDKLIVLQIGDCSVNHYVGIYVCETCGLQLGLPVDETIFNSSEFNDEDYGWLVTDASCSECGLTIHWDVIEDKEDYLVLSVVIKQGEEILYSGTNITYKDSRNSFPADRQPEA